MAGVLQEEGDADSRARTRSKLNISSFLRLPHLSDCFISTRNSMSMVLLLQMVVVVVVGRGWIGGGWLIYNRVWEGDRR